MSFLISQGRYTWPTIMDELIVHLVSISILINRLFKATKIKTARQLTFIHPDGKFSEDVGLGSQDDKFGDIFIFVENSQDHRDQALLINYIMSFVDVLCIFMWAVFATHAARAL